MARGFLMGAVWGTVVAGFGAGALSLAVGTPGNLPDRAAAETVEERAPLVDDATAKSAYADATTERMDAGPQGETSAQEVPVADATTPGADPAQPGRRPDPESDVTTAAAGEAPAPPRAPAQIGADTEPPAAPVVGDAPSAPEGAREGEGAQVAVATDAPVLPATQAETPGVPSPDTEPSISTNPAQPPLPPLPTEESALISETPQSDPQAPQPEAPAVPAEDDLAATEPTTPETSPEESPEPVAPTTTDSGTPEPAEGTRVGALTEREPAVPQGRLPSIAGDADTEDTPQDETASSRPDDTPLVRFAAKSDPAEGLPRMAIVLIDDGNGPLGPDALEAFPFPVSFALDPAHPGAERTASAYRDLGFEVMVLGDLPEGAQASDVEISLQGAIDAVPQAIGILEDPTGGLQENRSVATQVAAYLAASGHGLVALPKGLNTAQQLAAREGVPSATLFRDFDGEGQDARVIRRFLDQAAFRSKQEGAVIMLGRLRADTVSALVLWGLQDRASTVALVPVSTVLIESMAEN